MQSTTFIASILAVGAATAAVTPPTYANTTTVAPSYNGSTPTSGTASPSGTGVAAPTESFIGAGNKLFGSSAAMALAIVGGVALAL